MAPEGYHHGDGEHIYVSKTPTLSMDHRATLVIHEGRPERVYTESEVNALLRDIMSDQTSADVANGYVNVVIGWAEIFKRHGVQFLDPSEPK